VKESANTIHDKYAFETTEMQIKIRAAIEMIANDVSRVELGNSKIQDPRYYLSTFFPIFLLRMFSLFLPFLFYFLLFLFLLPPVEEFLRPLRGFEMVSEVQKAVSGRMI
jgi:hypothetical protein